jgi:hypothetical protein
MLEKLEGKIKNGQSREAGNIGFSRHRPKTNKTNNITQKLKQGATTSPETYYLTQYSEAWEIS